MTQFRCPACQRRLRASAQAAGKQVACPCGFKLAVPFEAKPTVGPSTGPAKPVSKVEAENSIISCECGRQLRAPANAAGKAIRCPCGKVIPVLGVSSPGVPQPAIAPLNAAEQNEWLNDLPQSTLAAQSPIYPTSYIPPSNADTATPYATPAASSKQSAANRYLSQASQEISRERRGAYDDGGSFANSGTIGGLMMMLGAVVWFVTGLFFGYIFFYPPVMFVIGLIGFVRGLLSN